MVNGSALARLWLSPSVTDPVARRVAKPFLPSSDGRQSRRMGRAPRAERPGLAVSRGVVNCGLGELPQHAEALPPSAANSRR